MADSGNSTLPGETTKQTRRHHRGGKRAKNKANHEQPADPSKPDISNDPSKVPAEAESTKEETVQESNSKHDKLKDHNEVPAEAKSGQFGTAQESKAKLEDPSKILAEAKSAQEETVQEPKAKQDKLKDPSQVSAGAESTHEETVQESKSKYDESKNPGEVVAEGESAQEKTVQESKAKYDELKDPGEVLIETESATAKTVREWQSKYDKLKDSTDKVIRGKNQQYNKLFNKTNGLELDYEELRGQLESMRDKCKKYEESIKEERINAKLLEQEKDEAEFIIQEMTTEADWRRTETNKLHAEINELLETKKILEAEKIEIQKLGGDSNDIEEDKAISGKTKSQIQRLKDLHAKEIKSQKEYFRGQMTAQDKVLRCSLEEMNQTKDGIVFDLCVLQTRFDNEIKASQDAIKEVNEAKKDWDQAIKTVGAKINDKSSQKQNTEIVDSTDVEPECLEMNATSSIATSRPLQQELADLFSPIHSRSNSVVDFETHASINQLSITDVKTVVELEPQSSADRWSITNPIAIVDFRPQPGAIEFAATEPPTSPGLEHQPESSELNIMNPVTVVNLMPQATGLNLMETYPLATANFKPQMGYPKFTAGKLPLRADETLPAANGPEQAVISNEESWWTFRREPLFKILLLLCLGAFIFAISYGQAARCERNMWLSANGVAKNTIISLKAGGAGGRAAVPHWLWDDRTVELSPHFYYK